MTSPTRIRMLAVAVSLVAASMLSGCAALGSLVPHTLSSAARPSVGDCWAASVTTAAQAAAWTSGGAVPCAASHQLLTYAVVTVKSSASTWRTSDGTLDASIASAAYQSCNASFWSVFTGAQQGGRLTRYFFVAPEQQWKNGARWVRCDVGVYKTGSLFADPSFAPLPQTVSALSSQVDATPELFAQCVTTTDSSGQTGPYDDPQAVVADCTGSYQWRFESAFTLPGKAGDPYPDDDTFTALTQADCGDAADAEGSDWIGYVPTSDDWAAGSRNGTCWFLAQSKPQT